MIAIADKWQDYQLIDAGNKDKLEIWKDVILVRPDPQAIWEKALTSAGINPMHNIFARTRAAEAGLSIKNCQNTGPLTIRIWSSRFLQPTLNIPVCFRNRLPTGIG